MILDKYKSIYFHVPKCAGSSINKFLLPFSEDIPWENKPVRYGSIMIRRESQEDHSYWGEGYMHATALEMQKFMGDEKFKSYFKFAVVRNTYERILSLLFWERDHKTFELNSVKEVIQYNCVKGAHIVDYKNAKIPQSRGASPINFFLCDENDNLMVDKIIDCSNLEQEFSQLMSTLGLPETNFDIKVNTTNHNHYSNYYTQEIIDLIDEVYELEIKKFGFKFDDKSGRNLKGILS
jgi:hypothetical protein